ncbi:hypothetical protein AB9K41_04465 [Cribrihabitans sp. XS_ASV171]
MGLDVFFLDGKSRKTVLSLRNPDTFFQALPADEWDRVNPLDLDFWVGEEQLDLAATALIKRGAVPPKNIDDLPNFDAIEDSLTGLHAECLERQSDLDESLVIALALLNYVCGNGRIICAWSA